MTERIECLGGPADGERIRDRGMFWMVVARIDEDGEPVPGSAGTYVRDGMVYRWEPADLTAERDR